MGVPEVAKKKGKKRQTRAKGGKMVGRPPEDPPPEMCARILEWITGGETLSAFCRKPRTPATTTVEGMKTFLPPTFVVTIWVVSVSLA